MNEQKTIIDPGLGGFAAKLQEAVQHGWEIDPDNGPKMWGFNYETGLVRNEKTLAAFAERQPDAKPKMSRDEALKVAREARAQKRLEGRTDGTAP